MLQEQEFPNTLLLVLFLSEVSKLAYFGHGKSISLILSYESITFICKQVSILLFFFAVSCFQGENVG